MPALIGNIVFLLRMFWKHRLKFSEAGKIRKKIVEVEVKIALAITKFRSFLKRPVFELNNASSGGCNSIVQPNFWA